MAFLFAKNIYLLVFTLHDLEFVVIPLYHPATTLYNGGMRQTLIDDIIRAAAKIGRAHV